MFVLCVSGQISMDKIQTENKKFPVGAWMYVTCEYCVVSGTGFCEGPIPRLEESYRLWCVILCDLKTSRMRWPWPALGFGVRNKQTC
jgi:hypothetical protein